MLRRDFLRSGLVAGASGLCFSNKASAATDGFYVPAEHAPHDFTLMQWPASRFVYTDANELAEVQATIARIASTISEFEPVVLLAHADLHSEIRPQLPSAVTLWDIPTEDLWARDSGPLFARDAQGNLAIRHIRFNGWGSKQVHQNDSQIAERVANRLDVPLLQSTLTGEPGGVEQDGTGTLLAHESSWLNDNRNPSMTLEQISDALLEAYGAKRILWGPGVYGLDITDFHIDSLARFSRPGVVLMTLSEMETGEDPFHDAAAEMFDILNDDKDLQIEVLPEPETPRLRELDAVTAYANFYVCNGAVIAQQFGDPETDSIAKDALQRHFPERDVIMLNADPLARIGGGVHCATREVPAV